MGQFHSIQVVGRGSETQHEVIEKNNYLIYRFVGKSLRIKR